MNTCHRALCSARYRLCLSQCAIVLTAVGSKFHASKKMRFSAISRRSLCPSRLHSANQSRIVEKRASNSGRRPQTIGLIIVRRRRAVGIKKLFLVIYSPLICYRTHNNIILAPFSCWSFFLYFLGCFRAEYIES